MGHESRRLRRSRTALSCSRWPAPCPEPAQRYSLAWQRATPQPSLAAPPIEPVAVFGADERVRLPAAYRDLQDKMGLLFNLRSRTVCTAFCVAPDTDRDGRTLPVPGRRRERAAHRRLLVRPQLRHRARLCARRRSRRGAAAPARDVRRCDAEHAPAHRRHQGLGARAARARPSAAGACCRYGRWRPSRSWPRRPPSACSRCRTTATSRPGSWRMHEALSEYQRNFEVWNGIRSRRIFPTGHACCCTPATRAAHRQDRRCSWKRRRGRK